MTKNNLRICGQGVELQCNKCCALWQMSHNNSCFNHSLLYSSFFFNITHFCIEAHANVLYVHAATDVDGTISLTLASGKEGSYRVG